MSLLDQLTSEEKWAEYLAYKRDSGHLTSAEETDLSDFVSHREYLETVDRVLGQVGFSVPEKKLISKMGTNKKRTVYTLSLIHI